MRVKFLIVAIMCVAIAAGVAIAEDLTNRHYPNTLRMDQPKSPAPDGYYAWNQNTTGAGTAYPVKTDTDGRGVPLASRLTMMFGITNATAQPDTSRICIEGSLNNVNFAPIQCVNLSGTTKSFITNTSIANFKYVRPNMISNNNAVIYTYTEVSFQP